MDLRLIAETDNIQPGDVLYYRRQYYELTVKCTVERVTKAYIFVKNEGGYEVKFKRRNAEDMAGTHYLYIEEQKNAAPAEPATEDLDMTEAILCVYGTNMNHEVISKEAALSVAEQAKAQGKIQDYRVEGGDKDGKIVAIIAEPDEELAAFKQALARFEINVQRREDFVKPYYYFINFAPYGAPGKGGIADSELDAYKIMYEAALKRGYINYAEETRAPETPEPEPEVLYNDGLEKLPEALRCSIESYGGEIEYKCYDLALWQLNGYPVCKEHMQSLSDMNSDNAEAVKTALEWHKSEVGKEETLAAYKTLLSPFKVEIEQDRTLYSWYIEYKPGIFSTGYVQGKELDAYVQMHADAMINGYVTHASVQSVQKIKEAQAEPEPESPDPTKPYINTDELPTQVYIPADDSHEARTVETEPVIDFEYYPCCISVRCPRCGVNHNANLRPDLSALEVLARLIHAMDACQKCGAPGPEGLKRALLSAMHAEADRIENPPELAEDEGSFSEMGYDPYSGGYTSDL